jgi:hypothetical protein
MSKFKVGQRVFTLTRSISTIEEYEALYGPSPGMRQMFEQQPVTLHVPSQATEAQPPNPLPAVLPPGTRAKNGWVVERAQLLGGTGGYVGNWTESPVVAIQGAFIHARDIDWSTVPQAEAGDTEPAIAEACERLKRAVAATQEMAAAQMLEWLREANKQLLAVDRCVVKSTEPGTGSDIVPPLATGEQLDNMAALYGKERLPEETDIALRERVYRSWFDIGVGSREKFESRRTEEFNLILAGDRDVEPLDPPPRAFCGCGQELMGAYATDDECGECVLRGFVDKELVSAYQPQQPAPPADVEQGWAAWSTSSDES